MARLPDLKSLVLGIQDSLEEQRSWIEVGEVLLANRTKIQQIYSIDTGCLTLAFLSVIVILWGFSPV